MADSFRERMERSSHLAGANAAYIEAMYERYLDEPNEVAPEWREYFDTLPRVEGAVGADVPHLSLIHI